ncbi:aspartate/glutamate racemase family protein [Methylocapsa sp. S129]|uniref:aspartate/glutamate racemase family protein n=1 Tax=Methylocapsa sp. S129 TaxID=1641869 RepID=UPI00131E16B8|nr:aspartate/glutamate racemase family protein [Methylocapsa sp. S129]
MKLLVVNPNTSAGMTARIGEAARAAASAGTQIAAVNPSSGPASIEGYFDEAFAVPGMLEEIIKGETAGIDAFVIACFDDTGLEAARCCASGPVIGIGEAAFHLATLIAHRFSVVTTLSRSIAPIEANLVKYGLDRRCARVRACDVPVLALDDAASGARAKLSAEIGRAKAQDGADAIVLGCAGMADLAASLAREHGLPVIDGVAAAVKLAEALVALGHATSKSGPYARPIPKAFAGMFSALSA